MTQKLLSFMINCLTERFVETNRLQAAQHLKNHRFKSNSLGSTSLLSGMIRMFGLGIRTCNPLDFFGSNLKLPNLERRHHRKVQSYMGI